MTDELPSIHDIVKAHENCDWLPGPQRWSNPEAKARYDELAERIRNIITETQRSLAAELRPLQEEAVDLYLKFASPTLYPVPKAAVKS